MSFEDTYPPDSLHQVGRYQITSQRRQIHFKDGSDVWLHGVVTDGRTDRFHRALLDHAGKFEVVDLRTVAPSLAEDVIAARPSDVQGIVYFTLRHRYASAELFTAELTKRRLQEVAP